MINVEYFDDRKIAIIELPDTYIDESIQWDFEDICSSISQDSKVRVVVLTSNSPDFVSAVWTSNFNFAPSVSAIKQPVLGVICRNAHGIGLEILLACDIRVCVSTSEFSMSHLMHGVIPSNGGTQRLPRLVGQGRALEIILTGRLVKAHEALEMGMVHQISDNDPVKDACLIAEKVASHGPKAAQYLKEVIYAGAEMTLGQGMNLEADMSVILQSTSDRTEGINSFLERRAPSFKGD